MNKRDLIAQLAPFPDETEVVACPHLHPKDACDEPHPVADAVTREPTTGEIVLHVDFWRHIERLRALKIVRE